jgi:hypothetical protein
VAHECRTGKRLFRREVTDYQGRPQVKLLGRVFGEHLVVRVADRQDFELRAFEVGSGKCVLTLKTEGVGPFGVHGRMSATVQHGRMILLSKDNLSL